ncbi:MAG: glycosyltransferase [Gemmatimonadetes bacterium]|nr:glycosyltransferase [Gemmatimonadota bacterium]
MQLDTPIIVHSHLRWDFVWQRPQQLLSRMSRHNVVLFVEEPIFLDGHSMPRLDITQPMTNVYRAVPMFPSALRDRYDTSIEITRELIRRHTSDDGVLGGLFDKPVQWFYTPMAAPAMIGAFGEKAIVYDCMDELSKFRFAPRELIDREMLLMSEADVVFTGGYKLSQSKARHHTNVHFFGCGVDVAHFGKARLHDTEVPEGLAAVGGRIAGYYGVIDERIDYPLLAHLAQALPDISVVMVGPVVKVAAEELPQAPNIHWLGQKDYTELPAIVKAFDVCLMPFALNEATEYINPTKTLEYMAAAKPIVSTAVSDVVRNFTPVVSVAYSPADFCTCVQRALDDPDHALIARGVEQARNNSWESIVGQMERILQDAVRARGRSERQKSRAAAATLIERAMPPRAAFASSREDIG